MSESEKPEVVLPAEVIEPEPATPLPAGMAPSPNYMKAIELGKVLAASGYFPEAREASKAAVRVMIAMDLGLSPVAGLMGIHTLEKGGRVTFLIESKLLGALVKRHPVYGYKVIERTDESCTLEFTENRVAIDDEQSGRITYSMVNAKRAGLDQKPPWKSNPRDMLTWRTLAEGVRLYFPDLLAGAPLYADSEFGEDVQELKLAEALEPPKPQPLADEKAEALREKAQTVFDELKAVNPDRLVTGRFTQMIAGAEHSHARLEAVLASLEDLRNTEASIAGLAEVLIELVGDKEAKPILDRAERRGSQRERIETLEKAIAEHRGSRAEPGGESDGE